MASIDREELFEKFKNLIPHIVSSEDTSCDFIRSILKKVMKTLCEVDAGEAEEIIECIEGNVHYNNFLTKSEADNILSTLVNSDGSKGLQWRNYDDFAGKINSSGFALDQKPYYNGYALWVTMNTLASDHNPLFNKWVKEHYFEFVFELAVSKLIDKDREKWIRKYFDVY